MHQVQPAAHHQDRHVVGQIRQRSSSPAELTETLDRLVGIQNLQQLMTVFQFDLLQLGQSVIFSFRELVRKRNERSIVDAPYSVLVEIRLQMRSEMNGLQNLLSELLGKGVAHRGDRCIDQREPDLIGGGAGIKKPADMIHFFPRHHLLDGRTA